MNFKDYIQLFEIFGSFNYEVPNDKKQQLYDFYMLNFVSDRSKFDQAKTNAHQQGMPALGTLSHRIDSGEMDEEDQQDYMLAEIRKKLLPTLKENLLDAVFFSLCAEFRHVFDRYSEYKLGMNPNADGKEYTLYSYLKEKLGNDYAKLYKKYASNYSLEKLSPEMFRTSASAIDKIKNLGEEKPQNQNQNYVKSFHLMEKTGVSRSVCVKLMEFVYSLKGWDISYGGKAWADIAKGWLKLDKATSDRDLFIYIDHIYDLQHNTDTVFNKLKSYEIDGGYSWIAKALDHKAAIKDPHEIIDFVSSPMKKLALRLIKMKFGMTYEDFQKKKKSPKLYSPVDGGFEEEPDVNSISKKDDNEEEYDNIYGLKYDLSLGNMDAALDLARQFIYHSFSLPYNKNILEKFLLYVVKKRYGFPEVTVTHPLIASNIEKVENAYATEMEKIKFFKNLYIPYVGTLSMDNMLASYDKVNKEYKNHWPIIIKKEDRDKIQNLVKKCISDKSLTSLTIAVSLSNLSWEISKVLKWEGFASKNLGVCYIFNEIEKNHSLIQVKEDFKKLEEKIMFKLDLPNDDTPKNLIVARNIFSTSSNLIKNDDSGSVMIKPEVEKIISQHLNLSAGVVANFYFSEKHRIDFFAQNWPMSSLSINSGFLLDLINKTPSATKHIVGLKSLINKCHQEDLFPYMNKITKSLLYNDFEAIVNELLKAKHTNRSYIPAIKVFRDYSRCWGLLSSKRLIELLMLEVLLTHPNFK